MLVEHTDPITPAYAHELCKQLIDGLRQGVGFGSTRLSVSASIGIALAPLSRQDMESLFSNADMALYASKKRGRACSTIFEENYDERCSQRKGACEGVAGGNPAQYHLSVAYQPIVNGKGEVVAYEALLRWHHALRGVIPPDVFHSGCRTLVNDCGDRLLCASPSVPGHAEAPAGPWSMSICRQTRSRRPDLLERMLEILDETGTDPQRIVNRNHGKCLACS